MSDVAFSVKGAATPADPLRGYEVSFSDFPEPNPKTVWGDWYMEADNVVDDRPYISEIYPDWLAFVTISAVCIALVGLGSVLYAALVNSLGWALGSCALIALGLATFSVALKRAEEIKRAADRRSRSIGGS